MAATGAKEWVSLQPGADIVTQAIFSKLRGTPTVARWAATAGITGFEVLPIDKPLWRFYRMYG